MCALPCLLSLLAIPPCYSCLPFLLASNLSFLLTIPTPLHLQDGSGISLSYAREFKLTPGRSDGGEQVTTTEKEVEASDATADVGVSGFPAVINKEAADEEGEAGQPDAQPDAQLEMTNVERLSAAMPIAAGGLVLREDEMPDCTLPMGDQFNVRVHVDAVTGERLLLATRDIASGETLMLASEDAVWVVEGDGGDDNEIAEEGGWEESEEEEEGEESADEAVVQCDKRECRREMSEPTEVLFYTKFGQDYCASCAAGFSSARRGSMVQTTVAERLAGAGAL